MIPKKTYTLNLTNPRLLHLAVQHRLVLRLLCIKLTLQGLDFIALVEALLEVLEVVIIDRRPDGGMDDKRVIGVVLRECAILNLHRLDTDNFHLIVRQLEVLRLRIGTHVYSCPLCSCTQGRLFGVLLRCGDGVVFTHLINARRLNRLCLGLSKRHAAEQGRGKYGSSYSFCYLQKGSLLSCI